jgi:aminopeptidase N
MKAAMWMHLLEMEMGKDDFQKGIEMYFEKWRFKHPYPEDFQKIMEEAAGKSLKKIFKMLNQKASFTRDDF